MIRKIYKIDLYDQISTYSCLSILFLCFSLGCSKPQSSNSTIKVDSAQISIDAFLPSNDSLSYIDFIHKFEETSEFFFYIFPNDNDSWSAIRDLGDSVILRDAMFNTRTRIPIDKAYNYFDLHGIGKIVILNPQHQKLTTGKLKRIEYFENTIDAGFVAVFQVKNPSIEGAEYCIGNLTKDLLIPKYEIYEDTTLDVAVQELLDRKENQDWRSKHYKFPKDDLIYSIVTLDTTSFILETNHGIVSKLYESSGNEVITELILLPVRVEGKPALLFSAGYSQSDITWTSLLIFDGDKYKRNKTNRLNL